MIKCYPQMKTKYIKIRISEEEHKDIQKMWKGYNMSSTLRNHLLEGPPIYFYGEKVHHGLPESMKGYMQYKTPEDTLPDGTQIYHEKTENTYFALKPGDEGYKNSV